MIMELATRFRRLTVDRRGAVAIMVAFMMAVIIGFASLGVEVVQALATQRRMQSAADNAAFSAANAQALSAGLATGCAAACTNEGYALAAADGFTDGRGASCTANPTVYVGMPCDGSHAGDPTYVEALIVQPFILQMAKVVFPKDFALHARAVAKISPGGKSCSLALAAGAQTVKTNGTPTVNFQNCTMSANSTDPNAVTSLGGAVLNVGTLVTSGNPGYSTSGGGIITAGGSACAATNANCVSSAPPTLNPYANLPGSSCGSAVILNSGKLNPPAAAGCYKGINLTGCNGGKPGLALGPGTYFITGNVNVSSGCTLNGTGVTIVLTGATSTASIAGSANVALTAQQTGTYAGVLFFSNSSALNAGSFLGGASMSLTGALVFPKSNVDFSGGGTTTSPSSPCTEIIANTMTFSGNSTLAVGCTGTGVKPIVQPASLVE